MRFAGKKNKIYGGLASQLTGLGIVWCFFLNSLLSGTVIKKKKLLTIEAITAPMDVTSSVGDRREHQSSSSWRGMGLYCTLYATDYIWRHTKVHIWQRKLFVCFLMRIFLMWKSIFWWHREFPELLVNSLTEDSGNKFKLNQILYLNPMIMLPWFIPQDKSIYLFEYSNLILSCNIAYSYHHNLMSKHSSRSGMRSFMMRDINACIAIAIHDL